MSKLKKAILIVFTSFFVVGHLVHPTLTASTGDEEVKLETYDPQSNWCNPPEDRCVVVNPDEDQ